ncbi:MAG: hypothetical protein C0510_12980, partial [Erythrobacter sp.]|nr:hypothetical protein [Erythrobacter sp.]
MSIQWADDFSRYGLSTPSRAALLAGLPYANLGNIGSIGAGTVTESPDPNDDGRAFQIGANGNNWPLDFRIALPTVVSGTAGVAFRAWLSVLPGSGTARPALVGFQRSDGNYLVYARIEQNGAITIQARVSGAI